MELLQFNFFRNWLNLFSNQRNDEFSELYQFYFRRSYFLKNFAVVFDNSLENLLNVASDKLAIPAKKFFTAQGGEIEDTAYIRDDDIIFVSNGEPFIAIVESRNSEKLNGNCSKRSVCHEWITLNVGGKQFATTRSTLITKEPKSMLARMFADDDDGSGGWRSSVDDRGAFLIDRSPQYFEPILNYLRHGQLILNHDINPQGVLEEAKFFGIESLVSSLEKSIQQDEVSPDNMPLTRKDVVKMLISTSFLSELRFQGVNLARADLSRLDLRHINFKFANLKNAKLYGSNLSYTCLERTDLSNANLEGAVLLGVKMLCANLEGANLQSCNMEDPAGNKANMEGANLKGANLEGSQMAGVNLRVATLKNANLQNCDLRGAVLAGADLENCNLSGSDLHEANLRGCNLKNTAFELIVTPLHMAQTIR